MAPEEATTLPLAKPADPPASHGSTRAMAELFFTNVFTSFLIFITWTNSLRVLREVRASTDVRSRSGATASFAAICNIFVLTFWLVFRYYHRAELRGERKSAWRIELLRVSICALLFVLWSIPLPIGRREHPSCFLWPEDGNAVGPGLQSIWTMRSTITNYLATPEGECRLPRRIAGFAMINSLTFVAALWVSVVSSVFFSCIQPPR